MSVPDTSDAALLVALEEFVISLVASNTVTPSAMPPTLRTLINLRRSQRGDPSPEWQKLDRR